MSPLAMNDRSEAHCVGLLGGVLLAVLVLFAGSFYGASQPPSPAPGIAVQNDQGLGPGESGKSAPDNDATEPAPAVDNASDPKNSNRPNENGRDDHDDDPPVSRWTKADVILTAVFSACLVGVGLLQWFILWNELTATEQAATAAIHTVEQMRLQQRAWISIDRLNVVHDEAEEEIINCILDVTNGGNTPGIIRRTRTHAFHERPSMDSVPLRAKEIERAMETETPGENPVAPRAVGHVYSQIIDLNKKDLKKPRNLKEWFVIARLEYLDIFGKSHVSQRCYLLGSEWPSIQAIEYKYGNQMT